MYMPVVKSFIRLELEQKVLFLGRPWFNAGIKKVISG